MSADVFILSCTRLVRTSQLLLIIMHARQLLCDLGHTLYESLCSYVYIRDENSVNNEYESSIMVIHHSLKGKKLIATCSYTHLTEIAEYIGTFWYEVRSLWTHTQVYAYKHDAVVSPTAEQCSMATTSQLVCSYNHSMVISHYHMHKQSFGSLNFPTNAEMVVDQLEEAGYTNISRQYFSVSALIFSLASLPWGTVYCWILHNQATWSLSCLSPN